MINDDHYNCDVSKWLAVRWFEDLPSFGIVGVLAIHAVSSRSRSSYVCETELSFLLI